MKISTFTFLRSTIVLLLLSVAVAGCKKDKKAAPTLAGKPGNPRFNLQFPSGTDVDLDLHVLTPNGTEIYYSNPFGQSGELDVDCLCGDCPNGPNENIYWEIGSAPKGTYKYWVEFYGTCAGVSSSEYTLRLVQNSTILETYTGTLTTSNWKSPVYTYNY